jgi:hypothetical protein
LTLVQAPDDDAATVTLHVATRRQQLSITTDDRQAWLLAGVLVDATVLLRRAGLDGATGVCHKTIPIPPPPNRDQVRTVSVRQNQCAEADVAFLNERLETRTLVDRAKSALTVNFGLIDVEAFKWIHRTAMDNRLTMKEVAERILAENANGGLYQRDAG